MAVPYTESNYEHLFSAENLPKYGATVETPVGNIRGLLMSVPPIQFESSYSGSKMLSLIYGGFDTALGRFGDVVKNVVSAGAQEVNGTNLSAKVQDTIRTYEGPRNPGLPLDLLLMKEFQPEYSQYIKTAIALANPDRFATGGIIMPPLNYTPSAIKGTFDLTSAVDASKLCTVALRKNLRIPLLQCDTCTLKYGPSIRDDNEPIYIIISLQFTSARAIEKAEAESWFLSLE